ncbi:MAG: pilus assembly FimT family protein, partial [Opitutales bacterium]
MSAHFHNDRNDRRAGFSLLELIGVMAVASILLAAAIPLTVNVIQSQRLADEKAALPALAEALKRGMLREQAFPLYANNVSRSQEVA